MEANDEQLWQVCRKLPSDLQPYGERKRDAQPDCSSCRWFQPLLRGGVLDWGLCANTISPRAGLLTFREQGCEGFVQDEEPTDDATWRSRGRFKDAVENLLIQAHGNYVHLKIGKLNDPRAPDQFWLDHRESALERDLELLLPRLLSRVYAFDPRQAAEEIILELKRESDRHWEAGRRIFARLLKRDLSTIRVPEASHRDNEFWRRVDDAISEGLDEKQ